MSFNTFGHLFRFTSFGESHGAAIGCVVDGCPPRIPLQAADIQKYLDKRRPGQSRFTTQRQEPDAVKILSGVFVDETGGDKLAVDRRTTRDDNALAPLARKARNKRCHVVRCVFDALHRYRRRRRA